LKSFGRVFVDGYFKVREWVMMAVMVDCMCVFVKTKRLMSKTAAVINFSYHYGLKVDKQGLAQALTSTATFVDSSLKKVLSSL